MLDGIEDLTVIDVDQMTPAQRELRYLRAKRDAIRGSFGREVPDEHPIAICIRALELLELIGEEAERELRSNAAVVVPIDATPEMIEAGRGAIKALIEGVPTDSERTALWGKPKRAMGYIIPDDQKFRVRWARMAARGRLDRRGGR